MDSEDVSDPYLFAVGAMHRDDFLPGEKLATTDQADKKSLTWSFIRGKEVDSGAYEIGQVGGKQFEFGF